MEAAKRIEDTFKVKDSLIFSDSQAVINALGLFTQNFKLVLEC